MKNKNDILDHTEKHKLTVAECELISFFRILPKERQQTIFKIIFTSALNNYKENESHNNKNMDE